MGAERKSESCNLYTDAHHQSTTHPLFSRNSSHACLSARFGRRSACRSGWRVMGSVSERRRCSSMVDLSYDWPFLVVTGSCITSKDMLSIM